MDATELLAQCRAHLHRSEDAELRESIRWIEREPLNPDRFYRAAELCWERGCHDLWQSVAHVAVGLPHVTYQQLFHRGETKLTLGDWSGWVDREARLFNPEHSIFHSEAWSVRWAKRPWDGKENISDKTLFIVPDGSHGDCLQMMRYVPGVASVADRVILGVGSELLTLAEHNFGSMVTVVTCDAQRPAQLPVNGVELSTKYHRYAWIMSLPAILGGPPPFVPLHAPRPGSREDVDPQRLQIGLCWARQRDGLESMFERNDVQWHTLQLAGTFADAANFMMSLDGVVSTDTTIAHLAGALGIPTVLIVPKADPRWGLADTTPWYPSMRLIRPFTPSDWSGVIDQLALQLGATGEKLARRAQ
jgi:hypothetical protein